MVKFYGLRTRSAGVCLIVAILCGTAVHAAETPAQGTARTLPVVRVEASEEAGYAAKDATTATRTDTPLIDVPQAVNVITQEWMEDRGITRLRDAVEMVPGVLPSTGYGGLDSGQVFSRGFFTETTYRDGFRDFSFASPHDPAVFERIEVLKGPASVLYGSNDPGGMVNYVSKRPLFESAYSIKVQGGSYDAKRIEADAGGPLGGERFAYRVVAAYDDSDSHRDYVSATTKLVAPSFAWQIQDGTLLTVLLEWLDHDYTFERGFTAEEAMFDLPIDRFLEEPGQNFAENDSRRAAIVLEHALTKDWQLRVGANYLQPEARKLDTYPLGLQADGRTLDRSYDYDETFSRDWALQAEAIGTLHVGEMAHTLLVGVERSYYKYEYWFGSFSYGTSIDILDPVYGQTTPPDDLFTVPAFGSRYGADTWAVYVQDQVALSKRWQLLAGLRYDDAKLFYEDVVTNLENIPEQSQSRVSPRVGAVFKPRESMSLYASYSTSFRPQIFYANESGDLPKPEIGKQVEIGWKQAWQRAVVTAALFEIRKQNVSTSDPGDPTRTIQTGEQRSRGVEFELQGYLTSALQVNAGVALLDAEVTKDEDIPVGDGLQNAPRRQANVWIKYSPQGDLGWFVGGGVLYTGEREASLPNNGVKIPEGTRLDAVAGFRAGSWKTQVNARNLTDEKLYNAWSNGFIIPQPGRSASVQVEFAW